jgi:hypothetical protein
MRNVEKATKPMSCLNASILQDVVVEIVLGMGGRYYGFLPHTDGQESFYPTRCVLPPSVSALTIGP